jgi:hypothetical protein
VFDNVGAIDTKEESGDGELGDGAVRVEEGHDHGSPGAVMRIPVKSATPLRSEATLMLNHGLGGRLGQHGNNLCLLLSVAQDLNRQQ